MGISVKDLTGIALMAVSALMASGSAVMTYTAKQADPNFSMVVASMVRVFMNPVTWFMGMTLHTLFKTDAKTNDDGKPIISRTQRVLWLSSWGVFGAFTVYSYYLAMEKVGIGLASVGASLSGICTCLLAAVYHKNLSDLKMWVCLLGTSAGIYLLNTSSNFTTVGTGVLLCGLSGICGGIAYFCVARVAGSASSFQVMMYWTVLCASVHLVLITQSPLKLPEGYVVWIMLIVAGSLLASSQLTAAISYRFGRIETLSLMAYLAPVITCFIDSWFFGHHYGTAAILGIALILSSTIWSALGSVKFKQPIK